MGMSRETPTVEGAAIKAPEQASSFGQYLQTFRIQNRIGLERVAEETRIRLPILRALEHEDFAHLPPDVFTIGFVRAYAQAVGADGDEAVRRYQAQRRSCQQTLIEPPPETGRRDVSGKLILALAMLAVLMAACLFVYRQWQHDPVPSQPAFSSQPTDAPASPPAERPAHQPPSEASKKLSMRTSPRHQLTIVAHENSWVKVVIDQGATSEHKLKAGDQLRLEAQTGFNLLIGNVGGVKLSLDNQPVTIPGKRGEVVNIHLP